jgi:hypothetical protein
MQNKINIERIKQFFGEIKESLHILRGYIPKGKEQILKDCNPSVMGGQICGVICNSALQG